MGSPMINLRRVVRHVNQDVYEYWQHDRDAGWQNVCKKDAMEWDRRKQCDYIELRHSMEPDINGLYGPSIKI